MQKWEHQSVVLRLKEKGFSVTRKGVLQGLDDESDAALAGLGSEGWEMVSVLPFSTGGMGMFSNTAAKTDALLAFFKRPVG